jgi:hypothetical protein
MKKHMWVIIAAVCVLALIVVAAILILRLFRESSSPYSIPEGHVVLMPGHWWKTEITEHQRSSLGTLWGKDITAAQLLQELWPDVLQQLPQEAVTGYEKRQIAWPTETYEEWKGEMLCNGTAVPGDEGLITCCIYVGTHESEEHTFEIAGDRGFTEDRAYRVSLYTGIRLE